LPVGSHVDKVEIHAARSSRRWPASHYSRGGWVLPAPTPAQRSAG